MTIGGETKIKGLSFAVMMGVGLALVTVAPADADWSRRMGNAQNTGNAGDVPAFTPENVKDLALVAVYPVGPGTATPVASGDLAIFQSAVGSSEQLHVIDLSAKKVLVSFQDHTSGTAATPTIGIVTVPDGEGGTKEEERVFGRVSCLNLDAIRADRAGRRNGVRYRMPSFRAGPGGDVWIDDGRASGSGWKGGR